MLGRRGPGNILKGMGLPRDPHNLGGLGTCMLLMSYLTQTNLMKTISQVIRNYNHDETTI